MRRSIFWKEVPFQNMSLKVGRSLSPRMLTSMTMKELFDLELVHHEMHIFFAEIYLFQAHDRKHFFRDPDHGLGSCCVCSARIRNPIDRLCCCLSQRQSLLYLLRAEGNGVAFFISRFLRSIFNHSTTDVEFAEQPGQFLMARV